MGSVVGGALKGFQGDPDFRTLSNVKNRDINKKLKGLLGEWDTTSKENKDTLTNFSSKFLADQPERETQARQESGVVDRYYNGGIETALSNLRNKRTEALKTATQRALDYATRTRKAAALGGGGGTGNSYLNRMALVTSGDILSQAALDEANQERQDLDFLERSRLGLIGQRGNIVDAALQRVLVPKSLQDAEMARRVALLGNLSNLDQQNNFYGLQQKTTGLDRWANVLGSTQAGSADMLGTAMNIYGGMGGGGGGGGGGGFS